MSKLCRETFICLIISIVLRPHCGHPVDSGYKSIGLQVSDKPSKVTPPEIVRHIQSILELAE